MRKVRSNPVCGFEDPCTEFHGTFSGAKWGSMQPLGLDRTFLEVRWNLFEGTIELFWCGRRFQRFKTHSARLFTICFLSVSSRPSLETSPSQYPPDTIRWTLFRWSLRG